MSRLHWTPEAVAVFEARRREWEAKGQVKVHTHVCHDEPEPGMTPQGKPVAPPHNRRRRAAPAERKPKVKVRQRSELEILFEHHIAQLRLLAPEFEYKGAVPGREFRIDFCWPERKIAVEVQGMVHRIKARFKADTEKHCLLVIHGWKVLPVSGDDIRSGRAVNWLGAVLEKL